MKQLTKTRAKGKKCRRCGASITWARTQATDRSLPIEKAPQAVPGFDGWPEDGMEMIDGADLAVVRGETRETARGTVPVVCYVRAGTGTHTEHRCG